VTSNKGRTNRAVEKPVTRNEPLVDCFVDIVSAITPVANVPDWDGMLSLPGWGQLHPRWGELVTLIDADDHLGRFFREYMNSEGTGADAGWDADALASELVTKPWQRIELQGVGRTTDNLALAARGVVDDVRHLAVGRTIHVPARFMFDGPQMSRRFSRVTSFGRVCWSRIPPPYAEAPAFEGLTVFAKMPLHLLEVPDGKYFYAGKHNKTVEAIERFISQFRVALLSRGERGEELGPPARVLLVQLNSLPIGPGNYHFGDPPGFGHGGPVRDLVAVCDLMERYQQVWDPGVDVAARRLGQAAARSGHEVAGYVDEDSLVDALIALESMSTISQELSFRLSVAVAHLLGTNSEDRRRIYGRVRHIYKLRSDIVHGNAKKVPDLLSEEKDEAIRIGIDVLEKLLFERRDLLRTKEWDVAVILGQPGEDPDASAAIDPAT
jgi:hypothetical protein